MIVTWTPNSSGFYSINLDSEFDNFLYVINSLSSNQLIEDVDYNDDEYYYDEEDYNLNAKLIGYYEANITYLIIFTQNNPANSLNVGIDDDIILSIYKTN